MYPKTLSTCIEQITRPALKTQGLAGTKIISEWASIVGEKLAKHSIPQKLSFSAGKKTDGTLTIAVENGFAPEFSHMQPMILERLSIYFGYKAVSRISISHTYTTDKEISVKANKKILPANCIDATNEVQDPELRAALSKMAKTLAGEVAN